MKDFPEWYKELCSDVRWFEYTSMNHKGKNFKKAAEFVYAQLLADTRLQLRDMSENRKHVYNKLGNMPFENVFPQLQQTEEVKEEKEWRPVSEEERSQWLEKWKKEIDHVQMVSSVPKLTARQIIEEGDWRAVSTAEPRTEVERAMILQEHLERVKAARTKVFKTAFPDASEEEVEAYLKKFDVI